MELFELTLDYLRGVWKIEGKRTFLYVDDNVTRLYSTKEQGWIKCDSRSYYSHEPIGDKEYSMKETNLKFDSQNKVCKISEDVSIRAIVEDTLLVFFENIPIGYFKKIR